MFFSACDVRAAAWAHCDVKLELFKLAFRTRDAQEHALPFKSAAWPESLSCRHASPVGNGAAAGSRGNGVGENISIVFVPTVRQWVGLLGQARGPARLRSTSSPRSRRVTGARPAASDPGPAGPVRPRRSPSRASWARAGLFGSSGRHGLRTHRARTSSPDRQPDRPGLGSPRQVADSPCGARGPLGALRCLWCGHVAIPGGGVGPRPAGVTMTRGTKGGAQALSLLSRLLHGSTVVSAPMASSRIAECGSTGAAE